MHLSSRTLLAGVALLAALACGRALTAEARADGASDVGAEGSQDPQEAPERPLPGSLILIGEGPVPLEVRIEALALTGRDGPVVAVNASSTQVLEPELLEAWAEVGVTELLPLDPATPEIAREHAGRADLFWLAPNGDDRSYFELWRTDVMGSIVRRRQAGAVVVGAGVFAEGLCAIRLSADPDPGPLRRGASRRARGMGLWVNAVVSASFLEAGSLERLMTVLLDRPRMTAVGLGPGAAIVVDDEGRVLSGHAWVFNPRGSKVAPSEAGERHSVRDLKLSILRPGDTFEALSR